jgi:hypothetical protein
MSFLHAKARRLVAIFLFACSVGFAALHSHAHAAPGEIVPEMIGEGVLSTPDDEFGATPSPDGTTIYFDKTVPPHYLYVICESHLVNGKWSAPEVVPFSGLYRDSDPVLSPDGNTMYFASDRPVNGKDEHRFQIWQVKRAENKWSEPVLVPGAINSEASQVFASVTNDGTMYFTSSRKNGQYDIYRSKLVNGNYAEAEDLGRLVNRPGVWSLEAWVAPDESYLLIGSFGREGGYGNSDLFVSFRQGGAWSQPVNLGPDINTAAREYSARVSADGKWLYYASEMGFPYEKRDHPISYQQFTDGVKAIKNGLGNLYRVPLEPVLTAAKARLAQTPAVGEKK